MFKKWKEEWLKTQETKLRQEHSEKLSALSSDLRDQENSLLEKSKELEAEFERKNQALIAAIEELSLKKKKSVQDLELFERQQEVELAGVKTEIKAKEQEILSSLSEFKLKIEAEKKEIQSSVDQVKREISFEETILQKRKEELAKESNNLKDQLKLIEAKAHPSSVWTEAFTAGFSKAWDSMKEVVYKDFENSKKFIYERAVEETLAANPRIHNASEIKTKIDQLKVRIESEKKPDNKEKLSNYMEALGWILNGHDTKNK